MSIVNREVVAATGNYNKAADITHSQLVKDAAHWLRCAKNCNPVFTEKGSANIGEMPDAIGFTAKSSIVVECKVSKSDLYADRKKPHRTEGGMGNCRYYLLTRELYEECKDFDFRGWGVVITERGQVCQVRGKGSAEFESCLAAERTFLRSRILEVQRFGRA